MTIERRRRASCVDQSPRVGQAGRRRGAIAGSGDRGSRLPRRRRSTCGCCRRSIRRRRRSSRRCTGTRRSGGDVVHRILDLALTARPVPDHRRGRRRGCGRPRRCRSPRTRHLPEGHRRLQRSSRLVERRAEARPRLPAGRVPLLDGLRPAGDDGRRASAGSTTTTTAGSTSSPSTRTPTSTCPSGTRSGGMPQSALFQNVHGQVRRREQGLACRDPGEGRTGCVAADLNGDGYTDLVVTTGNGRRGALEQRQRHVHAGGRLPAPYGWYAGAAVADVNGDGRPDIFVAGYTNMAGRDPELDRGLPDELRGRPRPALPQRGQRADGRRVQGGRRRGGPRVVAFPARPRRGLHRRERRRAPGSLRRERRGPERPLPQRARRPARLPLRRRGEGLRRRRPQRRDGRRRGRLQRRRPPRPVRHELTRTAARRVPERDPEERRDRATGPRRRKFATALDRKATVGWGDAFVDFAQQRQPRPDHRERRDPGHEPEEGHRADPGAAGPRRRQVHERERDRRPGRRCRRSSAAGSQPPTSPTTAGWASRSTRSAARSSCSRTRARSATGSRSR